MVEPRLVTLNRRHFIDDPEMTRRSDLRIGTPGALVVAGVQAQLSSPKSEGLPVWPPDLRM